MDVKITIASIFRLKQIGIMIIHIQMTDFPILLPSVWEPASQTTGRQWKSRHYLPCSGLLRQMTDRFCYTVGQCIPSTCGNNWKVLLILLPAV